MAISQLDLEESSKTVGKFFCCLWAGSLYPTQDMFWTSPWMAARFWFWVLGHKKRFRKFQKRIYPDFTKFRKSRFHTFLKFPETIFMA